MNYQIKLNASNHQRLKQVWQLSDDKQILDITAFGDFFVKAADEKCWFYNITDGEKTDVTELIQEHGLPPVLVELGGDWYQLDALSGLTEDGWILQEHQCLGFKQPLFEGGEYQDGNIAVMDFFVYQQRLADLLTLG
ncbi:MAG: hypothetical protein HRU20_08855 [Pseudomonadales bacterium]|nr:hypothetical protein [Pseudomonadales bacterium]